jgi:hypothetical protein
MTSDFLKVDLQSANGTVGVIGGAVPGCCTRYLKPQITAFDQNAIGIFALHKCGRFYRRAPE